MIRLEVQKVDASRLRINLFTESDVPSVISTYHSIDISGINALLHEVTVQIPRLFSRSGQDIDLYEQLKIKGNTLFQAVLGDLGKTIKQMCNPSSPPYLTLLMDEDVNTIPFEILYTGSHFLWEGFYITRQIAARTTKQNNLRVKRKPFKKMTMVGNPSDNKDIEKSVRNELYSISGLWEDELEISGPHFGGSTTRYRLAEFLSGCDLFHFSGHYEVQSGIKNTQDGWLLKNGTVFSAKDISNLENPPQFLFSNSCGDLSGFQNSGFIRALLSSGIRCMITTIGTVPTNQATHFSSVFYAAMQEGRPAAESVSIAKSSLVKRFGISDLSWMFYSLYGDGNLTFQFSKINLIKKYRNTIKFSIIGIGIISAIFLARSGIDIVKSREVRITSSPASIRIKVNDDIRGITPSICTVSSLDDIQLITSGYDTARYHLKKIDGKWLGVPLSAPDYILVNGQLSPTYESVEGSMYVNLIPSSLHRLRFTKVGRSKIMIQGIKGELTGRSLEIAIDSQTYRFIISKGNDGYDKQIQVTEDMVIDVSEISSTWQKNRFR